MSLTTAVCGLLRIFEKMLKNKHMNDTNDDTDMTGDADNRSILRTKCGQGINQCVHASNTELSSHSKWNEELLRLSMRNEDAKRRLAACRNEIAELRKQRDALIEALEYIAHSGLSARHLVDHAASAIKEAQE